MHNIYPDLSNDQFDIKYVKRKILASDIFAHDTLQRILEEPGMAAPPRVVPDIPILANFVPNDQEFPVEVGGGNAMHVEAGNPVVYLQPFVGLNLKHYRNNIFQIPGQDYTWNNRTYRFETKVNPVLEEIFTFQGYTGMPDPETYEVNNSGENINNITVDNSITFLTNFVNVRVRIFRNNILQSFKTDYTWNSATGKLTLTIPPVLEETFTINGY